MNWAEESHQDLVLILLDFEKAYNHISWHYLISAPTHLGFSDTWIRMVMSLTNEAATTITINGE
jgi:hypothetical protein